MDGTHMPVREDANTVPRGIMQDRRLFWMESGRHRFFLRLPETTSCNLL